MWQPIEWVDNDGIPPLFSLDLTEIEPMGGVSASTIDSSPSTISNPISPKASGTAPDGDEFTFDDDEENTIGYEASEEWNSFLRSLQPAEVSLPQLLALIKHNDINAVIAFVQELPSEVLLQFPQYNKDQLSFLHFAIKIGSYPLVQLSLRKGISIWSKDITNSHALHYAAFYQLQDIVELLLSKMSLSQQHLLKDKNIHSQTALDIAKLGTNHHITDALSQANMSLNEMLFDTIPVFTESLLTGPAHKHLKYLMSTGREDDAILIAKHMTPGQLREFSHHNKYGITLLEYAVLLGMEKLSYVLILKGASVLEQDHMGNTALHCATSTENEAMIDLLTAKGIKQTKMFYIKNKNGHTAVELANDIGNQRIANKLIIAERDNKPTSNMLTLSRTAGAMTTAKSRSNTSLRPFG